jgi:ABC-type phosphate transport system substrate-binding protein
MRTRLILLGALGALTVSPPLAGAAPCSDLPADQIVLAGSTAAKPLIAAMAKVLAAQAQPIILIYQAQGSCIGVDVVRLDTTAPASCAAGACIGGTATFWTAAGAETACDLPSPASTHVDVGLSDVWFETCVGSLPVVNASGGAKDTRGPVEAMLYVVPKASQQKAITAEEAYFVFGFGATMGMVAPWNVSDNNLAIRTPTSGTEQIMAHNINVPAAYWHGFNASSPGVATALITLGATAPNSSIGILAAAEYDTANNNRANLTALAFQAFHQKGAFYADSTATSFDKRNVRDGHYVNWGYLHMITRVDASGLQTEGAKHFVDWVTGNTTSTPKPTNPTWDIDDLTAKASLIPTCAMKVSRTSEGGSLSPFVPAVDCSTAFEAAVTH